MSDVERIDVLYQAVGRDLFGSQDLRTDLSQRDPDEAAFFTLVLVGAEIDNGGFAQLFTNMTGDLIREAITGADRFALHQHSLVLRDASETLFPHGVPLDHAERLQAWGSTSEHADEQLEALDDRWFALDDLLERRLTEYAQAREPL